MSIQLIKTLTEKRQNIWDEQKKMLDQATAENRDLSGEEQAQYEARNGDLTSLRSRIDGLLDAEEANKAAEEQMRRFGNLSGGDEHRGGGATVNLNDEFRKLAKREVQEITIDARTVGKAVEGRALQVGTPGEGGNTVPTLFAGTLFEHMVETSGLMQLGPTIFSTTGGEAFEVPVTTSHGAAALVAEEAAITGTDPAFGKRTLGAYKYGEIVTVSRELLEDTGVDLTGYLARAMGRNLGIAFGAHLITGTGTGQPTGVATTATAGKTGAAAVGGAFTGDDLIDLMFSVIAPYRASSSAGWLMKDSTLGAVRKLKDGNDTYLFSPAATVGAPDTLLGKPIQTDPTVAAVGAGAESVFFGDWSAYFIRLAGGVRFERSDEFAFSTDQVAFRAIMRGDGILGDQTGAIKSFTGGAAA